MDKALVFGTKDCRFESCQGHLPLGFDASLSVFLLGRLIIRRSMDRIPLLLGCGVKCEVSLKRGRIGVWRESSRPHVKRIIDPRVFGCAAPGVVPSQGNTQERLSKLKTASPHREICVTSKLPIERASAVTLLRTDTPPHDSVEVVRPDSGFPPGSP